MRCFYEKNGVNFNKYSEGGNRKRKLIITYLLNNSESTSSLSIHFSIRFSKANIMTVLKKLSASIFMRCFDEKNCARILRKYSENRKGKLIITYLTNNSESTSSLSIQPHVFSIRLSKANIMTVLKKLSASIFMRCFDEKNCARILRKYSENRKGKLIITYLTNNSESTSTLSIQPHVFSIRLSKADIMAILKKLPYSKGITIYITRGKALICHIEKGIEFFVFYYLRQFLPLFFVWVHTSWVMGAGVQQDNAVFRDFLKKKVFRSKKLVKYCA